MSRIGYCLALGVILVQLTSCSVFRSGNKHKESTNVTVLVTDSTKVSESAPAVVAQPAESAKATDAAATTGGLIGTVTPLWKSKLSYTTFSGKAKMRFEGPDGKQEFTAHIRLRKDSVIWITVTAALGGISVARVYITPDSILMINYLEKEYVRIPLSQTAKILPTKVDFPSLQNLIIGEPLRDGDITSAADIGEAWKLQVEDDNYIQQFTYLKTDSSLHTGDLHTRKPDGPRATEEYSKYAIIDGRRLSTFRTINIQNGQDLYQLDMNFQRIEFDQPLEFPFAIPEHYTRKEK
jgi:Domain of unknown function (DUF4292)